ncbi:MAG: ion channel [Chromatiales bacterium]|nr:ion channel [Chromatiales bacterium]
MALQLTVQFVGAIRNSRYLLLLIALSTLLTAYPFWGRDVIGLATFDIMFWGVLLGGLWTLYHDKKSLHIGLTLALTAFVATVFTYLMPGRYALLVSCLLDLTLLAYVTVIVLSHVVEEGAINADRIFGAICGYLLIGLTWALIYGALNLIHPGSFDLGEAQAATANSDREHVPHFADMDPMLYYSLVTLSTLGYGDIVAVTRAARSFSALEAIVGQLYMAVVIARLIGLHILARRKEQ